jgi:hypothetical protein
MMAMDAVLWSGGFPGIKRESFARSGGYFIIVRGASQWSDGLIGIKKGPFARVYACF